MRRFCFRATLFLIAEDYAPGRALVARRAFPVLDYAHVIEMLAAGHQIGSHSVSHPRLTDLSLERARDEIERSRSMLEQMFERQVRSFCYPYGAFDCELESIVAADYHCAVTTRFGRRHRIGDRFALRRIPVGAAQSLAQFTYRLILAREE
jgi:peptidoglycan/xylan/chitin deacetylase (PgdA/CDA1 family)